MFTSGERYSIRCFAFFRGYIKKGVENAPALSQTAYEIIMLSHSPVTAISRLFDVRDENLQSAWQAQFIAREWIPTVSFKFRAKWNEAFIWMTIRHDA